MFTEELRRLIAFRGTDTHSVRIRLSGHVRSLSRTAFVRCPASECSEHEPHHPRKACSPPSRRRGQAGLAGGAGAGGQNPAGRPPLKTSPCTSSASLAARTGRTSRRRRITTAVSPTMTCCNAFCSTEIRGTPISSGSSTSSRTGCSPRYRSRSSPTGTRTVSRSCPASSRRRDLQEFAHPLAGVDAMKDRFGDTTPVAGVVDAGRRA